MGPLAEDLRSGEGLPVMYLLAGKQQIEAQAAVLCREYDHRLVGFSE
jgi:hypothetical protein